MRPQVLSTGIWLIVLGMCGGGREEEGRRGRGGDHRPPDYTPNLSSKIFNSSPTYLRKYTNVSWQYDISFLGTLSYH